MNKKTIKLGTLLATSEHLSGSFKAIFSEYVQFFKSKQDAFKGSKKTYTPKDGTIDDTSKRGVKLVTTTVDEKIAYLKNQVQEYIQSTVSIEKTNALSAKKVELVVDGFSFGSFTALELMRIKSLIESSKIEDVVASIPVRSDSEIWTPVSKTDDIYGSRNVYQTPLVTGVAKTTEKEEYVLVDPNVANLKEGANYSSKTAVRTTVMELGDYTSQSFSGEWSHNDRALALSRKTNFVRAVIEALKEANDVEVITTDFRTSDLLDFIFYGKI